MCNIIDTDRWQRQETFTLFHDKHSYIGVPSSEKKNGEPRQKAAICRGRGSQNSATATKKCRPLRRPRQISKWGAAGIGDRDKNVSPTSATATDFKVRGGRYRRPRQKSAAHFGDRDRFQSKGRPVSATATKKCRRLRRPRQISK